MLKSKCTNGYTGLEVFSILHFVKDQDSSMNFLSENLKFWAAWLN